MSWSSSIGWNNEGWGQSSASFIGLGDKVTLANYWGVRGVTAAYSTGSNPALDLVDQAGANPLVGVKILANGNLDVASINAWVTTFTVTTILVSKLYDQLSTLHLTQSVNANRPQLQLTGLGTNSKPRITFASGTSLNTAAASPAFNQGFTVSTVQKCTNAAFATGYLLSTNGSQVLIGWNEQTGANDLEMRLGSVGFTSASALNTLYAMQGIANGAASSFYLNGTNNVLGASPGAAGITANAILQLGTDGAAHNFAGDFGELALATSAFSTAGGGAASLADANQRAYFGI